MNDNISQSKSNSISGLNVDKKMVIILLVFVVLGIILLASIIVSTNSLSALRGYASFQTNWTTSRKEVTFHLVNYLRTKDNRFATQIESSVNRIKKMEKIRIELMKDGTDRSLVRSLFLEANTIPHDIKKMISTFENFHEFPDFKESIEIWTVSDKLIYELESIYKRAHVLISEDSFSTTLQESYINEVIELDDELTEMQFKLSLSLASGTEFLNLVIIFVTLSLAVILLVTGGALSFRFLKSIRRWSAKIELSEQKFRSLFEQNPSAVFSISLNGNIIDANRVLEVMTGYDFQEMESSPLDQFIQEGELEKVKRHFRLALKGQSQTFETKIIKEDGTVIFVEITNIPIIVDEEITGIYGVVNDITHRKEAEQLIKDQLVEKTHLLSEIHDRVKNNLALVSTLVQLQQNMADKGHPEKNYVNTVSRIKSMALVHERLYQNETFSSIRIDEYINDLVDNLHPKREHDNTNLVLEINTTPVVLSIDKAIPTGLLLNEVLANAFKYGTGNKYPKIRVDLLAEGEDIIITISDNGSGLPKTTEFNKPSTLGFRLISVLVKQLRASFTLDTNGGTSFTFRYQNNMLSKKVEFN